MHSETLGIVAAIDRSAVLWHVRQSIWLSITCILWGNAIGWGTAAVGHDHTATEPSNTIDAIAPAMYLVTAQPSYDASAGVG